ncbi:MAG: hypothetical protein ACXWL5_00805 [Candidatus Chromulinivorax sp.]
MKLLVYKFIFFLPLFFYIKIQAFTNYEAIITPYAEKWKIAYVQTVPTEQLIILADTLLLTFQIVQASTQMAQARLVMQNELLNIISLSLTDSFDVHLQAQNNDMTMLKNAITTIEQAQEKIKFACDTLKNFGPLLINIDPTIIQQFIYHLKSAIILWARTQEKTILNLQDIHEEISKATNLFADIKIVFEKINISESTDHTLLFHGANHLSDMYKQIEHIIGQLTIIRQESIENFNNFLTLFFKIHYQILYNQIITSDENNTIQYPDISNYTLPNPDSIFTLA